MKSWKQPTNKMIDRTLSLVEKGTGRRHFFSRLKNPLWIQPLVERGYFQSPPRIRYFDDGYAQFPPWPELQYLRNVSRDVPDEVVNLVLGLPKVDNPSVYDDILDIALHLRGEQSAKLMPKILESLELDHQARTYQYTELLDHWTKENQTSAALELSRLLVAFEPDPQSESKQRRLKENPTALGIQLETSLEPSPRIGSWEYCEIMSKGVRPLAERQPYEVARILVDATENMIFLRTHHDDVAKMNDLSEAWCERLCTSLSGNIDFKKALVHTLTFTCEQVYDKSPDKVVALDSLLGSQQWRIFLRLRQHLYGHFPREQTKPWIRELILNHKEYHLWKHRYEFQQMIRSACEHFGASLLTKVERIQIFDAIRSGPSKTNYRAWVVEWLGEEFTEKRFQKHQRDFHRKQFKPFETLIFGKYSTYFQKLEDEAVNPISDQDYQLYKTRSGWVSNRSPRPPEDLAKLTDEELLTYINEWDEKKELYEGNNLIEVNIGGLTTEFQTVFKEQIIPDSKRLRFWMRNRENIERPIYLRMMINGMQADVKEKHFDRLNEWLTFSEWVLSHPDQVQEGDYRLGRQGDESREIANWYNSRRAVGNFIATCLEKDVDVPVAAREQLSKLLEMICTQFDSWLDRGKQVFLNQNDLIAEGINNTRSLALEALVKFGFWLRRHNSESEAPEVTTILERRFASETGHPLTLPEYAILGRDYNWIFSLNERWATEYKSDFFPQNDSPAWQAAFSSFICYNDPKKLTFEILWDDFDFALHHLADFKKQDFSAKKLAEVLGEHLFNYYVWDMYPLRGENSQLEQYYQHTTNNQEHWANLFDFVGRTLRDISGQLEKILNGKIIAFFDWRFEVREPIELSQFTFWLKAKCLDAEWRLESFSKILDVCKVEGVSIAMQAETLCEMLPDHTAKVVECFAKLTDGRGDDNIYIRTEKAKTILKAGLASADQDVHQNAERARKNLLRAGRFDLLDLED